MTAEYAAATEAELERARRTAEALQRAVDEIRRKESRAQKAAAAEERSRRAAERARAQQGQDAKERLCKTEELIAEQERWQMEKLRKEKGVLVEKRSQKTARKRRRQQEDEAAQRLANLLREERLDAFRQNWTSLRDEAELRQQKSAHHEISDLNHANETPVPICQHSRFCWPRKKGPVDCSFCGKHCTKYSFCCPDCNEAARISCKKQRCED